MFFFGTMLVIVGLGLKYPMFLIGAGFTMAAADLLIATFKGE